MRNEAIFVGDPDEGELVLRLYDVAELVYVTPDLGANIELAFTAGGSAGGFDIFGGIGGGGLDEGITPDDVVDLIMTSVSPETWENGESEIRIRGNSLGVGASAGHQLVAEFLRSQLHARNTLVQVDLRWVEINDDYMEEIGVDWQNAGVLTGPPGPQRVSSEISVSGVSSVTC